MNKPRFARPRTFQNVTGQKPVDVSGNGAAQTPGKPAKPSKATREALGRFEELNHFCDVTGRDCTAAEQAVWIRLFRHARKGECRVSRNRIAEEAGMSLSHAKRAIQGLVSKGFVVTKHRGNVGGAANVYLVRSKPQT